ncbi:hypothetical protein, partial [Escherichia coli]|uniref:hypothetical protein n=1 Tax=Escherichia coli TaxID=562 RepID=UPI003C2CE4CB
EKPHPSAGLRRDPDDMLGVAGTLPDVPSPMTAGRLEAIARELTDEGLVAMWDSDTDTLLVACPTGSGQTAMWRGQSAVHPLLGTGAAVTLILPTLVGPLRGAWLAWLANALNAAETADWRGEDRPHAFGAWKHERGRLY